MAVQNVVPPTIKESNVTSTSKQPSSPDRYKKYLEKEYGGVSKSVLPGQDKSQYDVRREQAESYAERDRARRTEALKRRSAAQGILGSGIQQKAQRALDSDVGGQTAARMAEIDVAQMAAEEQKAEAEKNREFSRGERLGSQAFAGEQAEQGRNLSWADLSLREQGLGENVRQFDNSMEFQRWATEKGYDENEITRVWQANQNSLERGQREELFYADLTSRENMLADQLKQNKEQFSSELEFRKWATNAGFDEAETARVWQAKENEQNRALTTWINEYARETQTLMLGANHLNNVAMLGYQEAANDRRMVKESKMNRYYAMGQAGKPINPDLSKTDPLAYEMYEAGKVGMDIADIKTKLDRENDLWEMSILSLSENGVARVDMMNSLAKLAQEMGLTEMATQLRNTWDRN